MNERIKAMAVKVKETIENAFTKSKFAIGAGTATGAAALLGVVAGAEDSTTFTVPLISDSITGNMMNGILSQITSLLPVVLPVMVGCLAFRKGLSFFQSLIRGL